MTELFEDQAVPIEPGEAVAITVARSGESDEFELVSWGESCLYFRVPKSSDFLEALRYDNKVEVEAASGRVGGTGRVRIIDVSPEEYAEESGERVEYDDADYRLLRLDPVELRIDGRTIEVRENSPSRFRAWFEACRFYSLSASVIPMLLGLVYGLWSGWGVSPSAGFLAVLGGVLLHLGTNLHNDVSDHLRGIDRYGGYGGAGVIQEGRLAASEVWSAARILYGLGALCGLPLVLLRGLTLLVVGGVGLIGAATYSLKNYGAKYSGLGDLSVFVLMGPLMAVGSSVAASGTWSWNLVMASIPVGFFVTLILHANNISDIAIDRRAGATTLAGLLGFRASRWYYYTLLLGGYGTVVGLVWAGLLPVYTLLVLLTVPLAVRHYRTLAQAAGPRQAELGELRFRAAQLHLLTGVLYLVGFVTPLLF